MTGASRGLGRGIAVGLGEAGATVYVTGRSVNAESSPWGRTLPETAEMVTSAGGRGIPIRCDHRNDEDVQSAFARVMGESGRLDLLVNNATAIPDDLHLLFDDHPFWQLPSSTWDDLFSVGVRSHFIATQHAARVMAGQGGGVIVNISSAAAQVKAGIVPYAVAKAAVDRMTADTAAELQAHNVAVVSVWPPPTSTDGMLASADEGDDPASWSTPVFTGRVIAALATDPAIMEKSGRAFRARELAAEFGIDDARGAPRPAR